MFVHMQVNIKFAVSASSTQEKLDLLRAVLVLVNGTLCRKLSDTTGKGSFVVEALS